VRSPTTTLRTPLSHKPLAKPPERCHVIGSGEDDNQVPSRQPRNVPYSTPIASVSMTCVISEYETFFGSRSVDNISEALGSNFSARHKARNWGRSSLGVFGFVLAIRYLPTQVGDSSVNAYAMALDCRTADRNGAFVPEGKREAKCSS
jgi:hypothetical protein